MKKIIISIFCLIIANFSLANLSDQEEFSLDKKFEELDVEEQQSEHNDQIQTKPVILNDNATGHIENLQESMRLLSGKIEELSNKVAAMNKEIDRLKEKSNVEPSNNNQSIVSESDITKKESSELSIKTDANVNKSSNFKVMKNEFDKAFAHMHKGEYNQAEQGFEEFVSKYPDDKMTGLAYFWLGETYYLQKDYEKSALNYLYSVKKFPKSSKVALATYKLGMSLANLGKKADACRMLKTFLDEYKDFQANVRSSASSKYTELKCKAGEN